MTYLNVGAVRRIESVTAVDERFELRLEYGEFTLPRPGVLQLGQEQGVNVGARYGTVTAKIEDAGHLEQVNPAACPLWMNASRVSIEASYSAVSIGAPARLGKQTSALVEADGLRWHACGLGHFSDTHDLTLRLDLAPRIKV